MALDQAKDNPVTSQSTGNVREGVALDADNKPVDTSPLKPVSDSDKPKAPGPSKLAPVGVWFDQRVINYIKEELVDVKELAVESYYKFEGICKKCGWHTMQNSKEDAAMLVEQHAQQHVNEIRPLVDAPKA